MQQTTKITDQEPITSTLLNEEPYLADQIAKFVERLPKRIADIGSTAGNQDWPTLKSQLHALKGLCANYGYPSISQLAEHIEDTLSQQQHARIAPLLEELAFLCRRVSVGVIDPQASQTAG